MNKDFSNLQSSPPWYQTLIERFKIPKSEGPLSSKKRIDYESARLSSAKKHLVVIQIVFVIQIALMLFERDKDLYTYGAYAAVIAMVSFTMDALSRRQKMLSIMRERYTLEQQQDEENDDAFAQWKARYINKEMFRGSALFIIVMLFSLIFFLVR